MTNTTILGPPRYLLSFVKLIFFLYLLLLLHRTLFLTTVRILRLVSGCLKTTNISWYNCSLSCVYIIALVWRHITCRAMDKSKIKSEYCLFLLFKIVKDINVWFTPLQGFTKKENCQQSLSWTSLQMKFPTFTFVCCCIENWPPIHLLCLKVTC